MQLSQDLKEDQKYINILIQQLDSASATYIQYRQKFKDSIMGKGDNLNVSTISIR